MTSTDFHRSTGVAGRSGGHATGRSEKAARYTGGSVCLALVLVLVFSLSVSAPAFASACTPGGSGPIAPAADTYADLNWPGMNLGSAYGWSVARTTKDFMHLTRSYTLHGYVRYPLPRIPSGCSLRSARLGITHASDYLLVSPPIVPAPIYVHPAASSWREGTLTWANQPGPAAPAVKVSNPDVSPWLITPAVAALYARGNTGLEMDAPHPQVWWAPQSRECIDEYGNRGVPYLYVSWK
jgi:hypothetical protein